MRCPFCAGRSDRVVDSRESREGAVIRRRRECLECSRRFTSYETVEEVPFMVVKRDGSRESFDLAASRMFPQFSPGVGGRLRMQPSLNANFAIIAKAGAIVRIDLATHEATEIVGTMSDRDVKRAEQLVAQHAKRLKAAWMKIHGRT